MTTVFQTRRRLRHTGQPSFAKQFVTSPVWIFFAGLAIRVLSVALVQRSAFGPHSPLWNTGPEMVNVATSIVHGHGFGSPFGVETGATAWLPPLYPYLIAAVFRIAGVRSTASALILLSLQALFSALTCIFIYGIAKCS